MDKWDAVFLLGILISMIMLIVIGELV